ncbi:MAG TPA: 6-bladed beta-propeller [Edaphocola sp.]|nr:6-bladed beta-propeller [Edaphocola sp.]
MKTIKFCLAILLITGCQVKNTEKESDDHIILDVFPQKNEELLLSNFVDSITFIKLETNNNEIISNITKVQLFNDKIFILDRDRNSIFVFDKNGSFIEKVQNIGRGPGEYLQLVDFEINNQGIFLLDYPNNILHYNFQLEYLQNINLMELYTFTFNYYKDMFWVCNEAGSQNELFHFSSVNQKGITRNTFIKKDFLEKEYSWHLGSEFNKQDSILYLSPLFDNRIYIANGEEIEIAYTINFGNHSFPNNQNIFSKNIYSSDFDYALKQHFWVTSKYLIFDFLFSGERKFVFFDKVTQKAQYGFIDNNLFSGYRFLPFWNDENTLIEVVDAITITEIFGFLKNSVSCLNSLSENDNPIVLLYHLKT